MKITLTRANQAVHLKAKNEQGNIVDIDGSENIGGEGQGARPMQLLLMGLGGCSSMDVLSILKKQKQDVKSYDVEIDASRYDGETPSLFKDIEVVFKIDGDVDSKKASRAVELSMDKYCSVTKIMEKTATITHKVVLNGEPIN